MGSWWQGKNHKDQDEIDIIGLYAEEKESYAPPPLSPGVAHYAARH